MSTLRTGDVVARKSHGGDLFFKITEKKTNEKGDEVFILRGIQYRLEADAEIDDLVKINYRQAYLKTGANMHMYRRYIQIVNYLDNILRLINRDTKPGRILHIDGDDSFLSNCLSHYKKEGIESRGEYVKENEQPGQIKRLLNKYNPDILVLTGHDGLKKDSGNIHSINNYRNSKYFIEGVKEARKIEPDLDGLCIFAGACQSYFEAIMAEGANFASSPGRVMIDALDPSFVSGKVAITDERKIVTPEAVAKITKSGSKGVGGIDTKGRLRQI